MSCSFNQKSRVPRQEIPQRHPKNCAENIQPYKVTKTIYMNQHAENKLRGEIKNDLGTRAWEHAGRESDTCAMGTYQLQTQSKNRAYRIAQREIITISQNRCSPIVRNKAIGWWRNGEHGDTPNMFPASTYEIINTT